MSNSMQHTKQWTRQASAVLGGIAIALIAIGPAATITSAQAPLPASDANLLWACYVPGSGMVYRIRETNPQESCRSPEHAMFSWSIEGPEGVQGAAGPTGLQGPQGPVGVVGPKGQTGAIGLAGPAGAVGPEGLPGATGLTGATGATGPTGAIGAAGPAGVAGMTGAIGPTGPQGAVGPAGPMGSTGATGPVGADGAAGAQGSAGPQGQTGPQGLAGPAGVAGPRGPAGPVGPTGVAGAVGPIGNTGAAGPAGTVGTSGFEITRSAVFDCGPQQTCAVAANCSGGKSPIMYGFDLAGFDANARMKLTGADLTKDGTGYIVELQNQTGVSIGGLITGGQDIGITTYAVCVNPPT